MKQQSKLREEMAEYFLASLEADELPWRKDWLSIPPFNAVTGRNYRGLNVLWLSMVSVIKGYTDPRWCTFKQANDNKWSIKKGAKSVPLEYWTLYDKKEKKNLSYGEAEQLRRKIGDQEFEDRVYPVLKTFRVFNGNDIDGIPELKINTKKLPEDMTEIRDQIVNGLNVGFAEGGNSAHYNPKEDKITVPRVQQFRSQESYMSTFLHEAAHSTGHVTRLNRDMTGNMSEEKYATEELRAEIASAMTAMLLGIESPDCEHKDNHRAYVQSWIKSIKAKKETLFAAIKDAEKISDYIIQVSGLNREHDNSISERTVAEDVQASQEEHYSYEIYQIGDTSPLRDHKFEGFDSFRAPDEMIKEDAYDLVYKSKLNGFDGVVTLELIYEKLNTDRPEGYRGHSLSVSDVIKVNKGNSSRAFFVDRFGFKEIAYFDQLRPAHEVSRKPAAHKKRRGR